MLSLGRSLARQGAVPWWRWRRVVMSYPFYRWGMMSYSRFAYGSVNRFGRAIAGLRPAALEAMADGLCSQEGYLFPYARELVGLFKRAGMLTVAVSGAPQECGESLRRHLALDEFQGTVFEVGLEGTYSGRVIRNMALGPSKMAVVAELRARVSFTGAFGFGDTDQDIPILEAVTHPVVLNPARKLSTLAARAGWHVFTARDDVLAVVSRLLEEGPHSATGSH